MLANYHTHTFRCHHAFHSEWQYAEEAYGAGFQVYGFSDHAPMIYPEGYAPSIRMSTEDLKGYVEAIELLKKRYCGKMKVLCGLEAEYFPGLWNTFLDFIRETPGIEYLILGQHRLFDGYNDELRFSSIPTEDEKRLAQYVDQVSEGMATGKFLYLAHPDLIHFVGDHEIYRFHMKRLCRNAKEAGLPLEINLQGFREDRYYPSNRFFEIAAMENCPCILGIDAHRKEDAANLEEIAQMTEFARSLGLNLLDQLELKENWL